MGYDTTAFAVFLFGALPCQVAVVLLARLVAPKQVVSPSGATQGWGRATWVLIALLLLLASILLGLLWEATRSGALLHFGTQAAAVFVVARTQQPGDARSRKELLRSRVVFALCAGFGPALVLRLAFAAASSP